MRKLLNRQLGLEVESSVTPIIDTYPPTYRGLVVFLSQIQSGKPTTAELSILYHWAKRKGNLAYCWLICSDTSIIDAENLINKLVDDTKNNLTVFKLLSRNDFQSKLNKRDLKIIYGKRYKLPQLEDAMGDTSLVLDKKIMDDPNKIRRLIEAIYIDAQEKELNEDEIIVDYTGGTKSVTAGIVLVLDGLSSLTIKRYRFEGFSRCLN